MGESRRMTGTRNQGTILVVEDDPQSLAFLNRTLETEGFEVFPACSGEYALEEWPDLRPKLILLDVHMKGMDGFELCRQLKANVKTQFIPLIFILGLTELKDHVEGLNLEAVDFLIEPFQAAELLARVRKQLALRKSHVALENQAAELRGANERLKDEIARRTSVEAELRKSIENADFTRQAMLSALEGRENTSKSLQDAQQQWQTTFESVNDAIMILGTDMRILRANKASEKITGLKPEQLVSRLCYEVLHGKLCPIPNCPVVLSAKSLHRETRQIPLGEKWLEVTADPMLDESSQCVGMVHIISDVTEQKMAEKEREKLQAQLLQAQKMESVGRLAGGVAHDFNNILGIIIGQSELALMGLDEKMPVVESLKEILRAAQRSGDLVRQLMTFARKQNVTPRVIDLNKTLSVSLKMLQRLIGEDIELSCVPSEGLWPVKIDPTQLDQILANLSVNARDAIAGVGRLTIETRNISVAKPNSEEYSYIVPGEYVQLSVADDGCGMTNEIIQKIFEPFFTTKEPGKGTGLGLAIVYGIVKQNNGFINVFSKPSMGTTFKICFPRFSQPPSENKPVPPGRIKMGSGETILLVEDEAEMLNVTKTILERLGYRVLAAPGPIEALLLMRENAGKGEMVGRVDLVISDVIMPKMNGLELVEQLRKFQSELKAFYVSGFTADVLSNRGVSASEEGVFFLQKPFSMAALASKIREILEK